MDAAAVDALLAERAIVFGSLPPEGRDLDLLVSPQEKRRLAAHLTQEGWLQRSKTFVRFAGGTAFAVDLVVLADWAPNALVAGLLTKRAEPLPGFVNLAAPAPHHRLLTLARRFGEGMELDERKRARLAAFSADDWLEAASEAPTWDLTARLDELRTALERKEGPAPPIRRALKRSSGRVVSLSGLDGSGKSTQGEYLRAALEALGYDVRIEWTKIARDPALAAIAKPVKAILKRITPTAAPPPQEVADDTDEVRNYPDGPPPPPDAGKLLRQKNPVLTWGWTLVVAWANGLTHRKTVREHVRAGRVVICDRYVLDSLTHLRYRYGPARRFLLQGWIIRMLSPKPACAFLLDVSPETARARKPEQYTTDELRLLQSIYREEATRLKVVSVNPEGSLEGVAAEIARATCESLNT